MFSVFTRRRNYRRKGDRHRDRAEWEAAGASYRKHLRRNPHDAAIWTQLGHTAKEAHRFAEAEMAYARSVDLTPGDPDALRHLGFLLKQQDRFDEAFEVFIRLFDIAPDREILAELQRLMPGRRNSMKAIVPPPGAILFTMQDFFASFTVHSTMTGIQRVQGGVAMTALDDPACNAHFIIIDDQDETIPQFLRVNEFRLRAILNYIAGDDVDQGELLKLVMLAQSDAVPIEFGVDNTIVVLGAFWEFHPYIRHLLRAKQAGARLGAYIYDLIPMTHPQYCDGGLSNIFWRTLAELLYIVDFLMTISDYTKQELRHVVEKYGGTMVPVRTIALAHSFNRQAAATIILPSSLTKFATCPYVACVSTIEGRKNHIYLVKVWQRLIAAGVQVPDLIFVGRLGWNIDELLALLAETGRLGGRVHLVHGLSDMELETVYSGALFTVFTSLMEGWGLPVGESLVRGIPCVASLTASIPEVGGDFVDYVDPTDPDDGVEVLKRMIENHNYRDERRKKIQKSFVPRTWTVVGQNLIAAATEMLSTEKPVTWLTPVTLEEGKIFRPGDLVGGAEPVEGYFSNPMGLAIASSFCRPEPDGALMLAETGAITFQTSPAAASQAITVSVVIRLSCMTTGNIILGIKDENLSSDHLMPLVEGLNSLSVKGVTAKDGSCTLLVRHNRHLGSTMQFTLVELSYSIHWLSA